MSEDETLNLIREAATIGGYLAEKFAVSMFEWYRAVTIAGTDFRPLYDEEVRKLGYGGNGLEVLLARKSDGQVFEIEIDVTARRVPGKTVPWEPK